MAVRREMPSLFGEGVRDSSQQSDSNELALNERPALNPTNSRMLIWSPAV